MRILELDIIEFGALQSRHIVLEDGMNIFYGDNETGKSTILLFIKFILYGLAKRKSAEYERSVSRKGHRAVGSMKILFEEEIYQIERSFVAEKTRGSEKTEVYRCRDGAKVAFGEEPGQFFLKVPREIFESSCGIGQMQCGSLGGEKGALAIQNLLSSADESVDIKKAVKRLDQIRIQYRHKTGKGGRIYELNERINEENQRLENATRTYLRISEIQDKLERNAELKEQNEIKLKEADSFAEAMRKAELFRRFQVMRDNERKKKQILEELILLKQKELMTEHIPVGADIARLNMLADSVEAAHRNLCEVRARYEQAESFGGYDTRFADMGERIEADGGIASALNTWRSLGRSFRAACAGVILACIFFVISVGFFSVFSPLFRAAFGLGGIALASMGGILMVTAQKRKRRFSAKYGSEPKNFEHDLTLCAEALSAKREHTDSLAAIRAEMVAADTHQKHLRGELDSALKRTFPNSEGGPTAARDEAYRLERFLKKWEELQRQCETLAVLVENDRKILSSHREEELRDSMTVDLSELSQDQMEKADARRKFYADRERALQASDTQLRTELINLMARTEDPMAIADRLENLKKTRDRCDSYYEAVVMALNGIEAAGEAMSGNVTPLIGRDAGKMMEYISGGRYSEMRTGSALTVSLVEEQGLTSSSDVLSGGTHDAAYISLRIALMSQIFGSQLPPLMMDEALCQLDDRRTERMIALIGKLAEKGMQCLIFTCHTREAKACEKLNISFNMVELHG